MIFHRGGKYWYQVIVVMAGVALLAAGAARSADSPVKAAKNIAAPRPAEADPGEWKKVVEAAKKEGKLVMSGDPSQVWRKSLIDLFREEYPEITIEYTGIQGRDFWPRVRQERQMGQQLWDVAARGCEPQAYDAKKAGFFVPLRPLLLPENGDDSKWIGGLDGLFNDKENKFMAGYTMYIQRTTSVNRDFIKEGDLKSPAQLLDPKFRGKIVIQTPTGGASFQALGNLAFMYGENFVRDLLTQQNVVVTDDKRQQAEWVVRGRYPIAVGFNDTQLIPFVKQGLGKNVTELEDKIIPVAVGLGGIFLFKDAPHPNAAKVYANWLLSKNTQLKISKNVLLNSRRTDVPPVVKEQAVDPARMGNYRFYNTEENAEISGRLLPMIKEVLRK